MKPWTHNLKALAWDLDGTLYPHNPKLDKVITQERLEKAAQAMGLSPEEAREPFRTLKRKYKSSTRALDSLGINGHQFFINLWLELDLAQFIHPNPELVSAFQSEKKFRHVILTNSNTPASVEKKLSLIGLTSSMFEAVLTSVEIGFNKPDHKAFIPIMETLQLKPSEIAYVGDREEVDIIPAKELGMRAVKVLNELNNQESTVADLVVASPEELLTDLLYNE